MNSHFDQIRLEVDEELEKILSAREGVPPKLLESMRYSIFAGGKRVRPIMLIAATEAVDGSRRAALPTAAAIEMIHTYTLIHDDLPAMDDDDIRRGLPTNHIKFGEATAILAGDALLTLAFEAIADPLPEGHITDPAVQLEVIRIITKAVGAGGTVGGQQMDIESEGKNCALDELELMHRLKTGAMIRAAVECGAHIGAAAADQLRAICAYGEKIGLAFQVIDDILDVEGTIEKLGKKSGADEKKRKMTYPSALGVGKSKEMAEHLVEEAIGCLDDLDEKADPLRDIANFISKRMN